MIFDTTNSLPSICLKHGVQMTIMFVYRSPDSFGTEWICPECVKRIELPASPSAVQGDVHFYDWHDTEWS